MTLQHTIKAVVRKSETQYVVECVEIPVVTQGATLNEALENLQEAVSLHLEGEDLAQIGLTPDPSILVTMEMELQRRIA
jgi:predicted RNase H-like HicB family nuclease